MTRARIVSLEGLETPCLIVTPHHDDPLPQEIVVDLQEGGLDAASGRHGPITFRLQPSSLEEQRPVYVELFDD